MLEGLLVPLVRALGPDMGASLVLVHGDHGVSVRCGVQVAGLEGSERRCEATLVMLRKALGHTSIVTIRRRGWMLVNDALPLALTLLDSYA